MKLLSFKRLEKLKDIEELALFSASENDLFRGKNKNLVAEW